MQEKFSTDIIFLGICKQPFLRFSRKMGRTRSGGPRLCADRSAAETLNPGFKERFALTSKRAKPFGLTLFDVMRKMGLEPTRYCYHKILSLARLPVPTLPHSRYENICHNDLTIITNVPKNVNYYFQIFLTYVLFFLIFINFDIVFI